MDILLVCQKLYEYRGYYDTIATLSDSTIMSVFDQIGDIHTKAAKRAIDDGNIEAAIANLYPALEAYEKMTTANFFQDFFGDSVRLRGAEQGMGVAVMIAKYYRDKWERDKARKYVETAFRLFRIWKREYEKIYPIAQGVLRKSGQGPLEDCDHYIGVRQQQLKLTTDDYM